MFGLLITILVIFAVLLLVTRAAGVVRGQRLGVAGTETTSEGDAQPALVGAVMGVVALLLIILLYVGITQWQWLGRPNPSHSAPVLTPAPVQASPVVGVGASPKTGPGGASPSPSK